VRAASAIYLIRNGYGILMDCADGSYNQLFDHFGHKSMVDKAIIKTKFAFITHVHGDHQLGILKILSERDKLLTKNDIRYKNKIYVCAPSTLMEWLNLFVKDSLEYPDMVVLVPSMNLNPENHYYYQPNTVNINKWKERYGDFRTAMPRCPLRT
jgi:ribonuclease BN (tRNA processing enzyme)